MLNYYLMLHAIEGWGQKLRTPQELRPAGIGNDGKGWVRGFGERFLGGFRTRSARYGEACYFARHIRAVVSGKVPGRNQGCRERSS